MKWSNPGHEMDEEAEIIVEQFSKIDQLFIYGAGLKGGELHRAVSHFGIPFVFVDRNEKKQEDGYCGVKVISPNAFFERTETKVIVICVAKKREKEIAQFLEDRGLLYRKNYYFYEEYMDQVLPILATYYFQKVFIGLCQIVLTSRCTLRCEKCAHGCQVKTERYDMSLEEAKRTLSNFFKKVDYVNEFVLIGGEPFLYKNIAEVVEEIRGGGVRRKYWYTKYCY